MDRSLGFGSTAHYYNALLRLGFPADAGLLSLILAIYSNSQAHSTKGTPPQGFLPAMTVCKSTVSDSISLPFRGSFHLSLAVLCAIGSLIVFSLGRWSSLFQTGFLVSRLTQVKYFVELLLLLTGLSPPLAGLPSSVLLTIVFITTKGILYCLTTLTYYPLNATVKALHIKGLGSSNFARRYFRNLF